MHVLWNIPDDWVIWMVSGILAVIGAICYTRFLLWAWVDGCD